LIRDVEKREAGKPGSLGSWEKGEALRAGFKRLRRERGKPGSLGSWEAWKKKKVGKLRKG
jgi:hypothetical protein